MIRTYQHLALSPDHPDCFLGAEAFVRRSVRPNWFDQTITALINLWRQLDPLYWHGN